MLLIFLLGNFFYGLFVHAQETANDLNYEQCLVLVEEKKKKIDTKLIIKNQIGQYFKI